MEVKKTNPVLSSSGPHSSPCFGARKMVSKFAALEIYQTATSHPQPDPKIRFFFPNALNPLDQMTLSSSDHGGTLLSLIGLSFSLVPSFSTLPSLDFSPDCQKARRKVTLGFHHVLGRTFQCLLSCKESRLRSVASHCSNDPH